ncbi:membrane protein UL124 [Panine betaherpesvirus 2]|uniref:Membrane protein UL124 n=1 Tax=Panine betaherpesvirus 2 TaxID=188763 RepID=Q8QRY5_9BETA|nr:membrane protein UL124 [Panine betaherpesvirus 2]AAM00753.1 membrane protein UL124 [Panine betaherpesvirus 2]QXV67867.1 membrane protein UL124 [Panine betaherpesvirus 2]
MKTVWLSLVYLCLPLLAAVTTERQLPSTAVNYHNTTGVTSSLTFSSQLSGTSSSVSSSLALSLQTAESPWTHVGSPGSLLEAYPTASALGGMVIVVGIVICLSLASTISSREVPSDDEEQEELLGTWPEEPEEDRLTTLPWPGVPEIAVEIPC